ncbi:MAG: TetR/AcrR family transcriptional regulator [Acidobacteriota bacterium]
MRKGEETRAEIVSKSLAMASTLGLGGLTIGAVAKAVGLSKSGLFAHFESKEDLQLQVLRAAGDRFVDRVVAPALRRPRGEPRIRAFFESWLEWEDAKDLPGGCPFIALAIELDDQPGPLRDALAASQRDWLDALATAGRIAMAEGHFRDDLDADQFAYDCYSIILAYHHFSRLLRDDRAGERARRSFEALLSQSGGGAVPSGSRA